MDGLALLTADAHCLGNSFMYSSQGTRSSLGWGSSAHFCEALFKISRSWTVVSYQSFVACSKATSGGGAELHSLARYNSLRDTILVPMKVAPHA
eukprot:13225515-Alexandrium_andersonii.AAC.1